MISEVSGINIPPPSIVYRPESGLVEIIDQTRLPHEFVWRSLSRLDEFCEAITQMRVRGAPLIGITAAYGLALACREDASEAARQSYLEQLISTRPTAVNLRWALERMQAFLAPLPEAEVAVAALEEAQRIGEEDIAACRSIGEHGAGLFAGFQRPGKPLQIMTHCNAGSLATLQWGTALSPIYCAAEQGIDLHVWVSETRPRNQGAQLTAWELQKAGIPNTLIVDNAAGHLMQSGEVDLCIVGADRVLADGTACNKIGTYLKALAAQANDVPFYVAIPESTIDWRTPHGNDIPIEQRSSDEVLRVTGLAESDQSADVAISAPGTEAANPAFDVTPPELVTGIITEHGIFDPGHLSPHD